MGKGQESINEPIRQKKRYLKRRGEKKNRRYQSGSGNTESTKVQQEEGVGWGREMKRRASGGSNSSETKYV